MQPGQVLCVHDYSQNMLLLYQDEVGAKHWDHEQITLHPTSILLKCITCTGYIHEEVIHITPDKTHDHKAVQQFIQTTLHHLEEKGIDVKEIIEFTDHASSQHKSRFSFFNLSSMPIPTTRHYFGVKHRKGPSDRAGANYKKFIKQTVLTGKLFENCVEVAEYSVTKYLQQKITHGNKMRNRDVYAHTLKKSFYHPEIFDHKEKPPKLRRLVGCRDNMHAVRNTGVPGVVEWRDCDCCCLGCLTHTGVCTADQIADEWKRHSLTNHTKAEIKNLDFSHWMPSFVKLKERDVEVAMTSADENLQSSDESSYELLSSQESEVSSEDDARSLTPDEISLSSEDGDEEMLKTTQACDSDVSVASDDIDLLQETSSDGDGESESETNYETTLTKYRSYRHYTSLKTHILKKSLPRPVTSIKDRMVSEDMVDEIALYFYPYDGPKGYYPVMTYGDGNCLP